MNRLGDLSALLRRALDPNLSETDRAAKARTAADLAADVRDLARWGELILPGATLDALDGSPEATDRLAARAALAQLRASVTSGDLFEPNAQTAPGLGTGLSRALPLIRGYATPISNGLRLAVPAVVAGNTDGHVVVKGVAPPVVSDVSFTVDEPAAGDVYRFTSGAYAAISLLLVESLDETGSAYLDAILADIADRAAERKLGELLIAEATAAAVAAGNLAAALDTAEGLCGENLQGPADLLVVSPADWPKVRRALAPRSADLPAPAVAVSVAMPKGTGLVTGRDALGLFATPLRTVPHGRFAVPKNMSALVLADRGVQLVVRKAAGIRTITGI